MTSSTTTSKRKTKARRPPGRPRVYNYLPYEEAKKFVQSQLITSRKRYEDWYVANQPKVVPKYPNRAYKEWTSWNDYLGTNNEFKSGMEAIGRRKSMRPHDQAATWAQGLSLTTQEQWLEYCRNNPIPSDIPQRPDLVYNDWRGWKFWLGTVQADVIELKQKVSQTRMLYLIRERGYPSNVVTFGTELPDVAALKQAWERSKFDVVRMYWFTDENQQQLQTVVNKQSSPYMGDDRHRIIHSVGELLWELDQFLDPIRL